MILAVALIILLLAGIAFAKTTQPTVSVSLQTMFTAALSLIVATSFLSLVLLQFRVFNLAFLGIGLSALLASFGFFYAQRLCFQLRFRTPHLILLLILALAFFLRYPGSSYTIGGQDPGIYANVAHSIARNGSFDLKDETLPLVVDDPKLHDYYLRTNYHSVHTVVPGYYEGVLVPGVYVGNKKLGQLVPQFYPLHPLWLAIGITALEDRAFDFVLPIFGTLTIIPLFYIGMILTRRVEVGLTVALLLAISPLHTYFSRIPVTEVIASFFLFSACLFYLRAKNCDRLQLLLSLLCLGCFFYTRITGFVFIGVFFALALWSQIAEQSVEQRRNNLYYFLAAILFYVISLVDGIALSFPYTRDIFRDKVGLFWDEQTLAMPAIFVGLALVLYLLARIAQRYRRQLRFVRAFSYRKRRVVATVVLASIFLVASYRAYQFAFTNLYKPPPGTVARWDYAGLGVESLNHINFIILGKFLTPLALIFCILGTYTLICRSFASRRYLLPTLILLNFLLIWGCFRFSSPYLYYYARYLLSELFPLMLIATSIGLFTVADRLKLNSIRYAFLGICLVLSCATPLRLSLAHARDVPLRDFAIRLAELDANFDEQDVVFIDIPAFPKYRLVTPLRLTHGRRTFLFDIKDHGVAGTNAIFRQMVDKGYSVKLITLREAFKNIDYLRFRTRVFVPTHRLVFPDRGIVGHYESERYRILVYDYLDKKSK